MAKIVYGLSEIFWEIDPTRADMKLLCRLANLGELHRLRDGKVRFVGTEAPLTHRHRPWEAEEERDRSGGTREYGFGSPGSLYRDRRDRRCARLRGHRCGKK